MNIIKKNTVLWWAFLIFLFTSAHLIYQYIIETSDKVPVKGGTMVEGIIGPLSYLPYTSKKNSDEFYQHLLFEWCVKNTAIGTGIDYINNLCDVTTRDDKNYFITITKQLRWIDNTPFSIDDILFTYQTILKENTRKLADLNAYGKTEIIIVDDKTLKISFPKQSVDNMLFFTNSLLPKHILEGKTLDYYLKDFAKQPIYISCAVLDLIKSHDKNYVFDISSCQDYYPKNIQVKSFDKDTEAISYLQNKESIVDYISIDTQQENDFESITQEYTKRDTSSNILYTLFFNINTVWEQTRKALAHYVAINNYSNIIKRPTPFSFSPQTGLLLKESMINQTLVTSWSSNSGTLNSSFPFLPKNIWIFWKGKYKEYYLDEFRDKYLIQFKFDTKYDKITIAANSPYEFTPDSYDSENKTCAYNLSIAFKNIKRGQNYYTVYGYIAGKQIKLLTMKVHYGIKPQITPLTTKKTNYNIIYLEEPNSSSIVENLKQLFVDQWVDSLITRSGYPTFNEFEGKLASKWYDMVLLPLELGLKSDLSALFSDNIVLNPSQYTNDRLIQLLQKYNNGTTSSAQEITTLYEKTYPFVVVGFLKKALFIRSGYGNAIGSNYTTTTMRTRLNNWLKVYETVVFDKEKLLKWDALKQFIKSKW